jgi:tetratricopeptide (TPR) repeat protein
MIRQMTSDDRSPLATHVDLLMRLDRMMADGQGDSLEADALRDSMEISWYQMEPEELDLVRQLSADLYTLHDDPFVKHPEDSRVFSQELSTALSVARDRGDYLRALKLLQQRPDEVSEERAAMLRGMCYIKLGLFDAGLLFLDHAARRSDDPEPVNRYILGMLKLQGRVDEATAITEELFTKREHPSIELRIIAADLRFDLALRQNGQARLQRIEQAKDLYSSALTDIYHDPRKPLDFGSASQCHYMLATCFYLLNEQNRAVSELSTAIANAPGDEFLYVLRGLLTCATDFPSAKSDFQNAVKLGTNEFWPFYYLAVDALRSENFDACVAMAEKARHKTNDIEMHGKLHELIAISLASKGPPFLPTTIETIRAHFRIAMTLSPLERRILANSEMFENSLRNEADLSRWQIAPAIDPTAITQQTVARTLASHVPALCN